MTGKSESEAERVLGTRPDTVKWLREHERKIVPLWISAIQRGDLPAQRGPRTRQMESAQLIEFFDGLLIALDSGSIFALDAAIQGLVTNRLGQGYTLTDFMYIANNLKSAIWRAAQESLPAERALDAVTGLEPVFIHSTTRLAWLASRSAETQLEEELERTRLTLAKLDRTKSDFINIAAHELKTPLTLVQGYSSILSSELIEDTKLHGILQGLTNGIKRLQSLIQDMIDVSLIDSNVLTLSMQLVSLYEITRLAADDIEQEAVNRKLDIKLDEFPLDVGAIYFDARRMYQVFTNLIGNAIKFTPDDGEIAIKAQILSDADQSQDFVEVSIADTGIGIAPDDLPHIFKKFYRVGEAEFHSTSKTEFKGGGPGLGLVIAKGIIEAHGGRIWAESPGYDEVHCPGSTFRVMMPIYTEPPKSPSERLLGLESESI